MMESRKLKALRAMAWERAKGELFGMLHTYYSEGNNPSNYNPMSELISSFVKNVEDRGLQE